MKARDVAVLGGLLIGYDFIATSQLSLMSDLLLRLSTLPLTPYSRGGKAVHIPRLV
jgi:hypothetical protein